MIRGTDMVRRPTRQGAVAMGRPTGPIPKAEGKKARRNKPTIPTTLLPVSGRKGPIPTLPRSAGLGDRGKAFWRWAWRTPQASAWDDGVVPFLIRRCQLEDDLDALGGGLDLLFDPVPLDSADVAEWLKGIQSLVRLLRRMAGGSLRYMKEMTDLDDRLGLNPRALAQLRWTIVDDPPEEAAAPTTGTKSTQGVTDLSARRKRLTDAS
jgi:hypothetical protein